MQKNQGINLSPGTVVKGKWHHRSFIIVKQLGSGAMGVVYLATEQGRKVAVKFGHNSSSITTEVNVLRTFQKVQDHQLGPSLLDVDDFVLPDGSQVSFYAMEYLKGKDLNPFVQDHGTEWIGILAVQLLEDLEHLHQFGWVFGDLKPDNLIVTFPPARLRWLDVGGTTQIGRAIKEYTEFYDRGYWGMGSRKADPQYDLFALAMVLLQIEYPSRFERGTHPEKTLFSKVQQAKKIAPYKEILKKALHSEYSSAEEMKHAINTLLLTPTRQTASTSRIARRQSASIKQNQKSPSGPIHSSSASSSARSWELIGIVMTVCLFYMMYVVMQWI
ncbi:serine/threonine protein kinase [Pontibacillus chungwhensis]|uniref:Protein kinase family protein n=2 Tax=Pontibacillus TaxID=289201 RepID=A0ABY8UY55_9BACI|nr:MULTISPECIES: protein kinase family protein [Pontibacillus]MCD5326114.1 protein kinase family protein [Pontibacillus sp. HN14]WIF98213.1 protein kinase family protein [Pontibacillus chungwhensis]